MRRRLDSRSVGEGNYMCCGVGSWYTHTCGDTCTSVSLSVYVEIYPGQISQKESISRILHRSSAKLHKGDIDSAPRKQEPNNLVYTSMCRGIAWPGT